MEVEVEVVIKCLVSFTMPNTCIDILYMLSFKGNVFRDHLKMLNKNSTHTSNTTFFVSNIKIMWSYYKSILDGGGYDDFPTVKPIVIDYLQKASDPKTELESYELANGFIFDKYYPSELKRHETDFDNNIFKENVLYQQLYQDMVKLYLAYYDPRSNTYFFHDSRGFTSLILSKYFDIDVYDRDDKEKIPLAELKINKFIGTINRFAFRGLLPKGIGGIDLQNETALVFPQLDQLNKLGVITNEAHTPKMYKTDAIRQKFPTLSHLEPDMDTPVLLCKMHRKVLNYIKTNKPKYMTILENEYTPAPSPTLDYTPTYYYSVDIGVNDDLYRKLMLSGQNPFYDDLVSMVEKANEIFE